MTVLEFVLLWFVASMGLGILIGSAIELGMNCCRRHRDRR